MPASYPASVKTFTARNTGDVIAAAHVGDLQDEVNAIEAGLLNGTAPLNSSNSTFAAAAVTGIFNAKGEIKLNGSTGTSTGQSLTYQGGSSYSWSVAGAALNPTNVSKSANYTAVKNDFVVCTGTFTITLPQSSAGGNAAVWAKNIDTGVISVSPPSGNRLDGSTVSTAFFLNQYDCFGFLADGTTSWWTF